jgi:hypothetical protein
MRGHGATRITREPSSGEARRAGDRHTELRGETHEFANGQRDTAFWASAPFTSVRDATVWDTPAG